MNNIIRLSSKGEISIHEYPHGTEVCRQLAGLISDDCEYVECVRPERLYSVFHCPDTVDPKTPGRSVCMLVDEEFLLKDKAPEYNLVASWLYGCDVHRHPILGNVLFVGESIAPNGGIDFSGLDDYVGLALLCNLNTVCSKLKKLEHGGKKYVL